MDILLRDFVSCPLNSFNIENLSVSEALDRVSKETGSFWTMWDNSTILVASHNNSNRRTYDRIFVAVLEIPA